MKPYLVIVFLMFAMVDIVASNCTTTLGMIPYRIRIDETEAGIQFAMTYDHSDDWDFEVVKLNGLASTPQKRRFVQSYFNLTTDNTGQLLFNVTKPIDLEELWILLEMKIGSIALLFICGTYNTKEVPVVINPINETPPKFVQFPYYITLDENTAIGTSIFDVTQHVKDEEIRRNGIFNYYLEPHINQKNSDVFKYFAIDFSSTGIVTVKQPTDFDDLRRKGLPTYFILNLTAEGIPNLKSWATLNVSINDVDDQKPIFKHFVPPRRAQYTMNTKATYRGFIDISPSPVGAYDPDSFDNSINYSLEPVPYKYVGSFAINRKTGQLSQISDVYITGVLIIKATENSPKGLSEIATVLVTLGNDTTTVKIKGPKESSLLLIIIPVIAAIIIIAIIIIFVVYHKKKTKSVSPKDDGTERSDDISHSKNWPAMTSGSKTELLASDMLNPAYMATLQGRGNTLPPLTKDSATGTGKKRSRRRNKNKEPEIFDGTREYEGKLDLEFFDDANTKARVKQSTRSRDTKTDPKYWITIPNDDAD